MTNKKSLFCILVVLLLTSLAGATCNAPALPRSIYICAPHNTATPLSPSVHISAAATPGSGLTIKWFQIYVAGVKVYEILNSPTIETDLTFSNGAGKITLFANDMTGNTGNFTAISNFTVRSPSNELYVSTGGSDSNLCTSSAPCATIGRADSLATAGTTVHVLAGTYTVDHITTSKAGTSTAPVTFVSEGAALVANSAHNDYVWQGTGDYAVYDGFDISGPRDYGIRANANSPTLKFNRVHNLTGPCTSYGGAGLYIGNYTGTGGAVYNNIVHDVQDGTFATVACNTNHGIYVNHANIAVYNNITYRNWSWGIHFNHGATNDTATNNLMFQNGRGALSLGATTGEGTNCNSIVANNISIDNSMSWSSSTTMREYDSVCTGTNTNKFLNNLFHGNRNADYSLIGGSSSGTVDADPLMVNYQDSGAGDYHLTSTSPAIDVGDHTVIFTPDFDNLVRPDASETNPDIGPYESHF